MTSYDIICCVIPVKTGIQTLAFTIYGSPIKPSGMTTNPDTNKC